MAAPIKVYGADWCPDVRRTRRYLDSKNISYDYVNIDHDSEGERKVLQWNNGRRRIPTVEIATGGDAQILSVPSDRQLEQEIEKKQESAAAAAQAAMSCRRT